MSPSMLNSDSLTTNASPRPDPWAPEPWRTPRARRSLESAAASLCANATRVAGESLDNGLGALPASYTGKEFMRFSASHVSGEKQDSGLGSVSQDELNRVVSAYEAAVAQRQR